MSINDPHMWPEALRAAMDAARDARPAVAPRPPVAPCRCGWRDDSPAGTAPAAPGPVADLAGADVSLTVADAQRACASCAHPILSGHPVVTHYLGGAAYYAHYHPACTTGVHP